MNRGVERPKERGKKGGEEEAEGDPICLKRRLLAQATSVVQTELSGGHEAQLEVELDVEVRAVRERLPSSLTGSRRLGRTGHLQGRSASSTEGVT